ESLTSHVELRDDDVSAVERMLIFLYNENYHDEGQDPYTEVIPTDVEQIVGMDVQVVLGTPQILITLSAYSQRQAPPSPKVRAEVDANALLNNVSMYAMADKYDLPELKELALCKFKARCVGHWNNDVITTIVKAVYESTAARDRGLRDQIVRIYHIYLYQIHKHSPFRNLLSENGEIAMELLDVTVGSLKRSDTLLRQIEVLKTKD
ncbi:MAG: hypothetical protein Q9214_006484, partial [Letrouitia sp. 1 TL-2023]